MWLYWVSAILLCAQSSCVLLGDDSLPGVDRRSDIILLDDDEGMSDSFLAIAQIQKVQKNIEEQLDAYRDYISSKMDKLEAACKKPAATTPPSFEYQVSTGEFKNARMNSFVETMTKRINDIAEISMDDLKVLSNNISATISESLDERFLLSEVDFSDLHSLIEGLANKEAVNQLKTHISSFITSNIAEVREHVKTMASKPELTTVTNDLVNSAKHLQEATETMDACAESTELVKDALPKVTESTNKIASLKAKWLRAAAASSCPGAPEGLFSSLESAAQERKDSIERLSLTLQQMEDGVYTSMDELTLMLKLANLLQNTETSPPPPTTPPIILSPTTKQPTTSPIILSPTTKRPIIPVTPPEPECLDSTFTSRMSVHFSVPDICTSAVRLQICHSEFAAFHCCRTCRRAGYVYPVPNIGASRQVPVLEALRSVMPTIHDMRHPLSSNPLLQKYHQIQSPLYSKPVKGLDG